jgi:polysaccharide export outer membrane protein
MEGSMSRRDSEREAANAARGRKGFPEIVPIVITAALLAPGGPAAAADYRLQPSDTLELFVAGVPELNRRAPVDLDGNVVFPLVGALRAEGRTPGEVQADFNRLVATKTLPQASIDGPRSIYIDPQQVTITIASYRPVYVRGDVARPGDQNFRPGLTVRQAIAVAGGLDVMRFRDGNPFMESAGLRGDFDGLWIAYANALGEVVRLKAELAGDAGIDQSGFARLPVPRELIDRIIESETEQLKIRQADRTDERSYLDRSVAQAEEMTTNLRQQIDNTKQDQAADQEDAARINDLFGKGLAPAGRVTQARQALLSSSLRYLAAIAGLGDATQRVETAKREIAKTEADNRTDILDRLRKAEMDLAKARSDISAVSEKLLYVGTGRTALQQGLVGPANIMIFNDGNPGGHVAAEGDTLDPGDVIDVTLAPLVAEGQAVAGITDRER